MAIKVFRREEKKYLINKEQYETILKLSNNKLEKDLYFESNICSIYFDTNDNYLIKKSLDKPLYKEKIRLRSYNVPKFDSKVYLEVKKKYLGVVNKRRIELNLSEFYKFLKTGELKESQISKELEHYFKKYNLIPKVFIGYNRYSYIDKYNKEFRLTFDYNIRSRNEDLNLELGDSGKLLLDSDKYIMEVKCLNSIPVWFSDILTNLNIYPVSFSK